MNNVVCYLHFQVYKTSQKLSLDFDQIKISEADFVEAMCRMVPSTHRIQDQSQSPLVPRLRPLLTSVVGKFIFGCNLFRFKSKAIVSFVKWQDLNGVMQGFDKFSINMFVFEGEICQKIDEVNKGHEFSYRPRILIRARPGQCVSTYIAPAILHHLEKLPCHKLDIPSLNSNSARYVRFT